MLITVSAFMTGLEAEEVSTEKNSAPLQEFVKKAQEFVKQNQIEKAIEVYERIVIAAPDDLESRAQLAMLYVHTKQYEKAAQTYNKLLEADPENIKYQDGLVYSLRVAGKVDEAFEIAQAYIQAQPEVGVHYARLAKLYDTDGKIDAAVANYKKAIELSPGDIQTQTHLKLAEHYFLNEDIAAAEKVLKNAMLHTKSEFNQRDIELQLIKLYLYQGNLEEVLQKSEAEGTPISYEMSEAKELAQQFRNIGEYDKYIAYLKIALVTSKSFHERDSISNELLKVYLEQDKINLALELYETEASEQSRSTFVATLFGPSSIEVKFGSDDARKILINAYKNQDKLDVLKNSIESKLKKNADNSAFIEILAEAYWDVNDYQKAAEAYHALSKVEPNNIRSFYYAAAASQKNNQPNMTKELLNRAKTALTFINYKQDGSFLGALATICLKNEMYDQAIELAGNAIIEAQNSGHPLVVNICLRIIGDSRIGLTEYYSKNNMSNKAMEQMLQTGIVHEKAWLILGPFDNTTGIGYDTEYIPEDTTQIDLTEKYEGVDELISWKKSTDDTFDGFIDLGGNVNWCVSYAWATVTSSDERKVFFRFSSDDQSKIWLNGKEVFTIPKAEAAILDRYTIPVTLKPGKNTILVKVCNEEIDWGFYLRITDADGIPFVKINDVQDN